MHNYESIFRIHFLLIACPSNMWLLLSFMIIVSVIHLSRVIFSEVRFYWLELIGCFSISSPNREYHHGKQVPNKLLKQWTSWVKKGKHNCVNSNVPLHFKAQIIRSTGSSGASSTFWYKKKFTTSKNCPFKRRMRSIREHN